MTAPYRVERLAEQDRSHFDCGVPTLNRYLAKQAGQDERRRVAVCYLLIDQRTEAIAGYYTLSAGAVLLDELPEAATKKLPRYPTVPVARVGRLGIATGYQGQGLGGVLVFDAVARASASDLGVYALVVDAKDREAEAFYEHHGFVKLAPKKLFLPITDAIKRLGGE